MSEYIYEANDVREAIEDALEEILPGYKLREFITKEVIKALKQKVNYYRFTDRNCGGCVSGPDECDLACGRGKGKNGYAKAINGDIFDCPVRCNGTMSFSPSEGMKRVDISDRDKPPYPIVPVEKYEIRE